MADGARSLKACRESSHHVAVGVVVGIHMLPELGHVHLRAAFEQRGDGSYADAGADVPREIDDAGAHVGLFPGT